MPRALLQESPRQLLEPLITITSRLLTDRLHMHPQRRISPVKPRRLFRITGDALARGFEQGSCRGRIESRIVARGQVELAARSTSVVSIIIDESSGHWTIGGGKRGRNEPSVY
jgi:hypothetical protein